MIKWEASSEFSFSSNKKVIIISVNKAFRGTREHGIQFIWYEDEVTNQPGRSFLYEELAKDHNLNKACFQSQFKI